MLFDRMGIDIWEVIEAAKTKPFGFQAFYPGPGLGGHCIPIDPFYLTWKAREYDFSTRFIELAGEINTDMPHYVFRKTMDGLNSRGKQMNGAKILVMGLAYKKDVDDTRESPSLKLIDLLKSKGAIVDYHDPYIPEMRRTRKYHFDMGSIPLSDNTISSYDAVVIATDHSVYDYKWVYSNANLIIDTRNAMGSFSNDEKIVKA
jgi:UDP-N-acetyl-D-glucosamine dehydrogenase